MSLYSRDGFDRGLSIPEYIAKPFWSISYDLRPIDLDSGSLLGDLYDRSVTALEGETLTFKLTRKLYLYNQYRNGSTTEAFRKKYDRIAYNNNLTYEARKAKLQKLIGKIPKPPGFKVWVSASNLGKNTGKAINIADYNDFRPVSDLITGYGEHSKGSPELVQKAGSPHYEDSKLFKISVYNDYIIEPNNEWFMVQISGGYGKKFDPIIGWSVYVKDATELPRVPLDFKFSKSQKELLAVISRNADLNEYIRNLREVVGDMVDDTSSNIIVEMQTRVLELYGEAVEGQLKISFKKFISSSSIASAVIQNAIAEYITKPQATAALGRLKRVKDSKIKGEVDALLVEHSRRALTSTGSPAANVLIRNLLSKFR